MALGSGLDVKLHPDGDMYGFMTHAQAMNMAMWDGFPIETTIEMTQNRLPSTTLSYQVRQPEKLHALYAYGECHLGPALIILVTVCLRT